MLQETRARTVDLEKLLLSALIFECEDDRLSPVFEKLQPEFFVNRVHQKVYRQIFDSYSEYGTLPSGNLIKNSNPQFELEDSGDDLLAVTDLFIDVVLERRTVELCAKVHKRSAFDTHGAIAQAINEFETLQTIAGPATGQAGEIMESGDVVTVIDKHLESLSENEEGDVIKGVPTPWRYLNRLILGWGPGLHAWMGEKKNMKTWTSLYGAVEAWKDGYPVVYVTKEMTKESVVLRVACLMSGVDFDSVRSGKVTDEELKDIKAHLTALSSQSIPFYVERMDGFGVETVTRFRSLIKSYGAKLAIFDGVYLAGMRKWDLIGDITTMLAEAGNKLDCAILATMQMEEDGVKYSKAILQDCETATAIKLNHMMQEAVVELLLTRDGTTGKFLIDAKPATSFREKQQPKTMSRQTLPI